MKCIERIPNLEVLHSIAWRAYLKVQIEKCCLFSSNVYLDGKGANIDTLERYHIVSIAVKNKTDQLSRVHAFYYIFCLSLLN